MGAIVVMVAVAGHVCRSNRIVVAASQRERNWHLWNDVIAYLDSGISSAHDDIIERLAPRKAFEITGHTARRHSAVPSVEAEQCGVIRNFTTIRRPR